MIRIILILVANALALLATSYLVEGIDIANFQAALVAALVLAVLNTFLKPLISLFTLPVNFVTFGLFSWVVSAFILWLASRLVVGFSIDGFLTALVGGIVLAFVAALLQLVVKETV